MWRALRRLSLTHWIFTGMIAGILLGWLDHGMPDRDFTPVLKPLSTVFLRLIKSVVVPLIFGTLVVGIAGHGDDLARIGRLALKALGYFWAMTTIALVVGLLAGNLAQPHHERDRGQRPEVAQRLEREPADAGEIVAVPRDADH